MHTSFHANGKLLLTGEYAVLDGARALAVPTTLGQSLIVEEGLEENALIQWESVDRDGNVWFSGQVDKKSGIVQNYTDPNIAQKLTHLFQHVLSKRPNFLISSNATHIQTQLEFHRDWGLGSSSTLVHLLAQWADINPYALQFEVFGGSGYDIACAGAKSAILYQKQSDEIIHVEPINYHPSFSDQLYLVYLGQKQNSRSGISHYRKVAYNNERLMLQINQLTAAFYHASTLIELELIINELETFMSNVLQFSTAKMIHFPDYWGEVKSLGAWGGDFVLVTSNRSEATTRQYFLEKGKSVFLSFFDLVVK